MMLHTINKSPFEKDSLKTCLRLSREKSSILMIEDGVYGAIRGARTEDAVAEAVKTRSIYALEPDLKARGIDLEKLVDGIIVIDYDGFVKLAVESSKVQSWM